jgi:hypothetical protein
MTSSERRQPLFFNTIPIILSPLPLYEHKTFSLS